MDGAGEFKHAAVVGFVQDTQANDIDFLAAEFEECSVHLQFGPAEQGEVSAFEGELSALVKRVFEE